MASQTSVTLSRRLLAPGVKSLRAHLQSELTNLRQTPVLVISSEVGASSSTKIKPVADSCQWVKLTLAQHFSMRTVPTTISSAVPTRDSLEQTLELMQRTGAASVVSVGSGAAMDLGKAVQATLENDQKSEKKTPLILVPTTFSGVLASGASHSLFLDNEEETLVPFPQSHQAIVDTVDGSDNSSHAIVSTLEPEKYMEPIDATKVDELLYAVAAILLDASLRESSHPSLPMLLQNTTNLISQQRDNDEMDATSLIPLLYQSAGLLSYGLGDGFEEEDNRSITIALASSLIPTLFPETHPTSFLASLTPGICHLLTEQQSENEPLEELVNALQEQFEMKPPPSLVPVDESLQGFSVPDMALSHIQANQAVWKPADVSDDIFVQVLQHCMKQ